MTGGNKVFIKAKPEAELSTIQIIVGENKGTKLDLEYLSQKLGKHDMEINNLNQRLQS